MKQAESQTYNNLHVQVVQLINEMNTKRFPEIYKPPFDPSDITDRQAHVLLVRALENEQEDAFRDTLDLRRFSDGYDTDTLCSKIWQLVVQAKQTDPDIARFGAEYLTDDDLWSEVIETAHQHQQAQIMFRELANSPVEVLTSALRNTSTRSSNAAMDYLAIFSKWDVELAEAIIDATLTMSNLHQGRPIVQRIGSAHPKELHAALKRSMANVWKLADLEPQSHDCKTYALTIYIQEWYWFSAILIEQKAWDLLDELVAEVKNALNTPEDRDKYRANNIEKEYEDDVESLKDFLEYIEKNRPVNPA